MSIQIKVLGKPAFDNAVFVTVDTGQSLTRLLFDCGSNCLDEPSVSEVQSLDGVFFSHFHMDHISGFDSLLRFNFDREPDRPLQLFGPEDTLRVMHHKLQGFTWNLVGDSTGVVDVREFSFGKMNRQVFHTRSKFVEPTTESCETWEDNVVLRHPDFQVSMIELPHGCVSAGYVVRENVKTNIDVDRMQTLGLKPGPWIQQLKQGSPVTGEVEIENKIYSIQQLRQDLVVETPGASFAYLTDFRASEQSWNDLVEFVTGVDVLVCENSYASKDSELAQKNFHMTTKEVALLAKEAAVDELILFHLSHRYVRAEYDQQLAEAQEIFGNARWPDGWFQG